MQEVDALLTKMRLPTYYTEPRFHCSIAWELEPATGASCKSHKLLENLDAEFGEKLRDEQVLAAKLCIRIGSETFVWHLGD
jgi:Uncharacterised conserved protein